MTINYFGQSFFKITVKNEQGDDIIIAIDPYTSIYGLKPPAKFEADIVLVTHNHKDHNNLDLIKGTTFSPKPFIISGQGEYEIKGIMIYGIPSFHDNKKGEERGENIIYLIGAENIWLSHLGDFGQDDLENNQLEKLKQVDILMIPVGGKYTINAKQAANIISQIEPRVIIPMHYKISNLELDIDGVEKFIKEQGITPEKIDGKLKINKKNLPTEDTKLFILKN